MFRLIKQPGTEFIYCTKYEFLAIEVLSYCIINYVLIVIVKSRFEVVKNIFLRWRIKRLTLHVALMWLLNKSFATSTVIFTTFVKILRALSLPNYLETLVAFVTVIDASVVGNVISITVLIEIRLVAGATYYFNCILNAFTISITEFATSNFFFNNKC
jgi:hypothetical protein